MQMAQKHRNLHSVPRENSLLLSRYAQETCDSTAAIIGYNLFITDDRGIIIACSDPNRGMGTLHEASLRSIRNNRWYTEDEEDARLFRGTNPGITVPLSAPDGVVIGTIGVTGPPDKLVPFALILKKQVEMTLREKALFESMIYYEGSLQKFVQRILGAAEDDREDQWIHSARSFGFLPEKSYIAAIFYIPRRVRSAPPQYVPYNALSAESTPINIGVLTRIRNTFKDRGDVAVSIGNDRFLLLKALREDRKTAQEEAFLHLCEDLTDRFRSEGKDLLVGIGSSVPWGYTSLGQSIQEADRTLTLATIMGTRGKPVQRIEEYRLEEFLWASAPKSRKALESERLKNLKNQPDWRELRKTIFAWCENSFRARETSESLHIHRNTLHYRLKKIRNLSFWDLHLFREVLQLYLLLRLDQITSGGGSEGT